MFAIAFIFASTKIVIYAYETISEQIAKKEESKIVNEHLEELYHQGEMLGMELISDEEIKKIKRKYEQDEIAEQKKVILKAETLITQKKMPYGTCVMLDDIRTPVKVIGNYGYMIQTAEGINFMLMDENYYTISPRQYELLKSSLKK